MARSYEMTVKLNGLLKNKIERMKEECEKNLSCATCQYNNGNPASLCKSELWGMVIDSVIKEIKEG